MLVNLFARHTAKHAQTSRKPDQFSCLCSPLRLPIPRHGFTPSAFGLSRVGFRSGLAFHTKHLGGKLHASPYRVCHAFCMPFSCSRPSLLASHPLVGPVRTIVRGSGRRPMLSHPSATLTSGPTRRAPRRRSVGRSARGTPAPVGSVMPLAGLLPCPRCFMRNTAASLKTYALLRKAPMPSVLSGLSVRFFCLLVVLPFGLCVQILAFCLCSRLTPPPCGRGRGPCTPLALISKRDIAMNWELADPCPLA